MPIKDQFAAMLVHFLALNLDDLFLQGREHAIHNILGFSELTTKAIALKGLTDTDVGNFKNFLEQLAPNPTHQEKIPKIVNGLVASFDPGALIWTTLLKERKIKEVFIDACTRELSIRESTVHQLMARAVHRSKTPPDIPPLAHFNAMAYPVLSAVVSDAAFDMAVPLWPGLDELWTAFINNETHKVRSAKARLVKGQGNHQRNYEEALAAVNKPGAKVTVTMLKRAIETLRKWSDTNLYLGTMDDLKRQDGDREYLLQLLETKGATLHTSNTARDPLLVQQAKERAKVFQGQIVASPEEMQVVIDHYHSWFTAIPPDDNDAQGSILQSLGPDSGVEAWASVGDLGDGKWAAKTPEQLRILLGYGKQSAGAGFAPYRDLTGRNDWDDRDFKKDEPIELMWHQMTAIAAAIDRLFSETGSGPGPQNATAQIVSGAPPPGEGILLADDVGLGKTIQIIGILDILRTIREGQNTADSACWPPLLDGRRCFGANQTPGVPDLPSIIVVPNSLTEQWIRELKIFLKPKMFDILLYPAGSSIWATWYKEVFSTVKDRLGRVIIVVSSSTLSRQQSEHCLLSKGGTPPSGLKSSCPPHSLFKISNYNVVVFDEIHDYRTKGQKFEGAKNLVARSHIALGMTATPVFNSPKDLGQIGRLLRIETFLSSSLEDDEKFHTKLISKVTRAARRAGVDHETAVYMQELIRAPTEVGGDDDPQKDIVDAARALVQMYRTRFGERVIRRSAASTDYQGQPILKELPGRIDIPVFVKLREDEHRETDEVLKQNLRAFNPTKSKSAFHSEYRQATCWPGGQPYPIFESLEDYQIKKGSKCDAVIRIVKHHLAHDNAPPVSNDDDSQMVFPPVENPDLNAIRTDKIVIYCKWAMIHETIQTAFAVNGVEIATINGTINQTKRRQFLDEFLDPANTTIRVLLISTVGLTGLNMTAANIGIMLDLPWGDASIQQFFGRFHRKGQKKVVLAYKIIADGTIDVVLTHNSYQKYDMLTTFFNKPTNTQLFGQLTGRTLGNDDDDDDGPDTDSGAASKAGTMVTGKGGKRKRESKEQDVPKTSRQQKKPADELEEETQTPATPPPKRKRKAKSKESGPSKRSCSVVASEDDADDEGATSHVMDEEQAIAGSLPNKAPPPALQKTHGQLTRTSPQTPQQVVMIPSGYFYPMR